MMTCYDDRKARSGEGGDDEVRVDWAEKKTRNPHLGCGEKERCLIENEALDSEMDARNPEKP